jgi:hypothetical protein
MLQNHLLYNLAGLYTFSILPHLFIRRFSQVNSFEMHFARELLFSIVVTLDNYYKEIYENNPLHYCHCTSSKSTLELSKLFLSFFLLFSFISFYLYSNKLLSSQKTCKLYSCLENKDRPNNY